MKILQRSKILIVGTYVVTVSVALALFSLSAYHDWKHYESMTINGLVHQAVVTNNQIENSLLDASRRLDVAKAGVERAIAVKELTRETANSVLKSTAATFTVYKPHNLLGIIFYADKDGRILADSTNASAPVIDVHDRLYFKKLSSDPSLKWYVGEAVLGRRNNNRVFHLAMPLLDEDMNFRGVLMQQILTDELVDLLVSYSPVKSAQVRTFQHDGYLAFSLPAHEAGQISADNQSFFKAISNLSVTNPGATTVAAQDSSTSGSHYIGLARTALFGLVTTVSLPVKDVFQNFIWQRIDLILIATLGLLLVSFLFYRLYTQFQISEQEHERGLHDSLTGLRNRRAFDADFPRFWADARREKAPISILFVDIDHFKRFNDLYGHEVGDSVLTRVAKVIDECARRPLDFCCRWGGEEFVIVLPNTDLNGATSIAERVMQSVSSVSFVVTSELTETITVSIGVASTLVTNDNATDDLVDMADKAMLQAKSMGRNCYKVFERL